MFLSIRLMSDIFLWIQVCWTVRRTGLSGTGGPGRTIDGRVTVNWHRHCRTGKRTLFIESWRVSINQRKFS